MDSGLRIATAPSGGVKMKFCLNKKSLVTNSSELCGVCPATVSSRVVWGGFRRGFRGRWGYLWVDFRIRPGWMVRELALDVRLEAERTPPQGDELIWDSIETPRDFLAKRWESHSNKPRNSHERNLLPPSLGEAFFPGCSHRSPRAVEADPSPSAPSAKRGRPFGGRIRPRHPRAAASVFPLLRCRVRRPFFLGTGRNCFERQLYVSFSHD